VLGLELNAELLDDVPGALWTRALIEAARPPMGFVLPDLQRVVVAIDPALADFSCFASEIGAGLHCCRPRRPGRQVPQR
jgi:phage terminase large subunit-like protein